MRATSCPPSRPPSPRRHTAPVAGKFIASSCDTEAESDIRFLFGNSPAAVQAEWCERLDAVAIDDLFLMILPYDIAFTEASIPGDVMVRTVTELCDARFS